MVRSSVHSALARAAEHFDPIASEREREAVGWLALRPTRSSARVLGPSAWRAATLDLRSDRLERQLELER
jgi:hypothetical protein